MATYYVRSSGGDFTTLKAAIEDTGTADGDTIIVEKTGTESSSATITVGDAITVQVGSSYQHPGHAQGTISHFQVTRSAAGHVFTVNNHSCTFEGLDVKLDSTGNSDECFRLNSNNHTFTFKKCLIWAARNTTDQDGVYIGNEDATVNAENCISWGFGRAAWHPQNYSGGKTQEWNLNSCTAWDCAKFSSEIDGGAISVNAGNTGTCDVYIYNCSFADASKTHIYSADITYGYTIGNNNVHYRIDRTVYNDDEYGTGGLWTKTDELSGRTATDSDSPGTGDWVVYEDITSAIPDLRLKSNAENDAEEAHSDSTGPNSLSMPSTDIIGTTRTADYCMGAHEIGESSGYTITADGGSYTITGTAASIEYNREVTAAAGSMTITGQDATLTYGSTTTLTADAGSYTITGTAADLEYNPAIDADAGTYTLAGQDANLQYGAITTLTAEAGAFAISGTAANLEYGRVFSAEAGAYTITGQDATLTYTQADTLNAEAGAYTLTGTAAALQYARIMAADAGAFTITGQDAGLTKGQIITAESGAYALTGADVSLLRAALVGAEPGAFTWTGFAATLDYSGALIPQGRVTAALTARQPAATLTARQPGVTLTAT